jgi:phenol 2-monooxygenase
MLDQLGLADELAQSCFACRASGTYNAKGESIQKGTWKFMEEVKDTAWDFAFVLRQKYQEEIFRRALRRHGVKLHAPAELVSIDVDETIPVGSHRVTATVLDGGTKDTFTITCKYLIGCDGGRSTVRRLTSIPFDGDSSEDKWVRVDGVLSHTNNPTPRAYCAIESPTHGNVLWAPLDHGATRIGFAFTPDRQKGYEVFDEAAAEKEAVASVKPLEIEFSQVDWYTIYAVGQRVARSFFSKSCIFLAGDACHTHSSGAAQGMNTGIHDSVNLAWKLSLVLQGRMPTSILDTYEAERRPNVERLINYDKDISVLMTGRLPKSWTGSKDADISEILTKLMDEAAAFTTGLDIYFSADGLLNVASLSSQLAVRPGQRGPDATLLLPGTFETTRLHRVTPNTCTFYVVVFAGEPASTASSLSSLYSSLHKSTLFSKILDDDDDDDDEPSSNLPISFLTIPAAKGPSTYELLEGVIFGRVYFDADGSAHERYGVKKGEGGVVILRPDGWVGMGLRLGSGGPKVAEELERYFRGFLNV